MVSSKYEGISDSHGWFDTQSFASFKYDAHRKLNEFVIVPVAQVL